MRSKDTTSTSRHNSSDLYTRVKLRTSDGRGCDSGRDNSAVKNVKSMNGQGKKIMANNDVNSGGISKKKECLDFIVKRKELVLGGNNTFPSRSTKMASFTTLAKQEAVISSRNIKGNIERRDGLANLNDEGTALKMLEVGDMVWGRVESHPWWPGEIFDEAFARPSVRNTKKKGHLLVAFYGDNSYGWFEPGGLIPFGPHFIEKSKQTSALGFLTAVGEAKDEVNRRAALGLTCLCRNHNNFRTTRVQGFLEVNVCGFENGSIYPVEQIERARHDFQPIKTLSFLKKLAVMPRNDMQRNVGRMKNVARLLAYRRAVFEEFDETYAQAFGVQPRRPGGSPLVSNDLQVPPQAPLRGQPVIGKATAFDNASDRSKPSEKRPSSEENPFKKQKTSNGTKLSAESPLRGQPVFGKATAFDNASDRSKPSEKRPSSKENPFKKQKTSNWTKLSAESSLRGQPEIKKAIAFEKVTDRFSSCSKSSKKRPSSEDNAIKKPKNETKSSTGSKKTHQIPLEVLRDEKVVGPTEPTTLFMKFSPESRLPSVFEVKAKFARFGINESETHMFWKTSTRQVVFKEVSGAQAAYNYALQNNPLFRDAKVRYSLRASKVSFTDGSGESSRQVVEESPGVVPNLKSCLKKLPEDESGSIDSTTKVDNALNGESCLVEARKNKSNQITSSTTTGVDISQQMMILLLKCNDIVTDLMSSSS